MDTVGFYFSPTFLEHHPGAGHPEGPDRLQRVLEGIDGSDLVLDRHVPGPASRDALLKVHREAHLDRLESIDDRGGGRLDPDTSMSPQSWQAAREAAGAVIEAVEAAMDGSGLDRAFCAVRPPGHHATADRAMGFCLLNNIAVGAAHALGAGCKRVAIFDFDVHHGNGTQDIFYEEARVLYVSTHQWPFYPGTGKADETGLGQGAGANRNFPLNAGTGDRTYSSLLDEEVLPALEQFAPDLLMLSAGFDAHMLDPLGGLQLSTSLFASMTERLVTLASRICGGRIVSVLEGGYDRPALAESVVAHIAALGTSS